MCPLIEIWNTLHDGELTGMSYDDPSTLTLVIRIPYVRNRISFSGDSFILKLSGLKTLKFSPFDNTIPFDLSNLAPSGLEILSTRSEAMPVEIATTQGVLLLDFDSLDIRLDTGEIIDCAAIFKASDDYWTEWSPI